MSNFYVPLTWENLNRLAQKYGDSFFLFDAAQFEQNFDDFLGGFRKHYPSSFIAYSYKTNYTPALLAIVKQKGGLAEVVSRMEYDLALRLGVTPEQIVFNGPCKEREDLFFAWQGGSIVNLDSEMEIEVAEAFSSAYPHQVFKVGVRCNFDTGHTAISRFGFDVESKEFAQHLRRLAAIENCHLAGLHCHFSTPDRSVESYARICERMLRLCDEIFQDRSPDFLDLGGGFFSPMSEDLRAQFSFPIPSYQEYADVIAPMIAEHFRSRPQPNLLLEPGVALTANIFRFAARILNVKQIRSRKLAIVSGSIHNIKPTLNKLNLPVTIISKQWDDDVPPSDLPIDLVGYTCMEHDCLFSGFKGAVQVGDFAVFENVGAYTNVLKPPFIRPAPPILRLEEDRVIVVKQQETLEDIFSTYVFP
jgi:diaminopimelate decarboxylase